MSNLDLDGDRHDYLEIVAPERPARQFQELSEMVPGRTTLMGPESRSESLNGQGLVVMLWRKDLP